LTRGFLPLLTCVLVAGIATLSWATGGFRVVTSDGAWRLAVERSPVPLADIWMIDQAGQSFALSDYRGRAVLVDFIYTRCPTICGVLGADFRNILDLSNREAGGAIDLLSISFDPDSDDLQARQLYGGRFDAVPPRWRVAVPVDKRELATLLHSLGIVVIPDGIGGFVHSNAIYLVDTRGRLARVLDPEALSSQLATALTQAAQ
jgi:protein SCO1/2